VPRPQRCQVLADINVRKLSLALKIPEAPWEVESRVLGLGYAEQIITGARLLLDVELRDANENVPEFVRNFADLPENIETVKVVDYILPVNADRHLLAHSVIGA